jgi:hypothetical protein
MPENKRHAARSKGTFASRKRTAHGSTLANEQTGFWRAALLLTAGGNLWQDLQKQGTSCKLDLELADTVAALV